MPRSRPLAGLPLLMKGSILVRNLTLFIAVNMISQLDLSLRSNLRRLNSGTDYCREDSNRR